MTDEWDVGVLDLDAYLSRLGYAGGVAPTAATLAGLHRAHLAAIPFENLDIRLGRGVSVDLGRVQAKLVLGGRGGYCHEHGVLFGAVLQRLGFPVDRLLARIGDAARPRPRTHLVLAVRADGERWLADVGFGSGLLEPLPLAAAGPRRQGGWTYELVAAGERCWQLRERQGARWVVRYGFTEEPQHAADVLMANHFSATHPRSPFVRQLVVVHKDDEVARSLLGRRLTVARPDQDGRGRQLRDAEFGAALGEHFGLSLPAADVAALTATLPPDPGAGED